MSLLRNVLERGLLVFGPLLFTLVPCVLVSVSLITFYEGLEVVCLKNVTVLTYVDVC